MRNPIEIPSRNAPTLGQVPDAVTVWPRKLRWPPGIAVRYGAAAFGHPGDGPLVGRLDAVHKKNGPAGERGHKSGMPLGDEGTQVK